MMMSTGNIILKCTLQKKKYTNFLKITKVVILNGKKTFYLIIFRKKTRKQEMALS